jgi:ribosome biogenesis GTPase
LAAERFFTVNLKELGWNGFFEAEWNDVEREGRMPGRVIGQSHEMWQICGVFGEARAEASGRLRLAAEQGGDWPAVGDWVAVEGSATMGLRICEVLPRRTQIVRKAAGTRIAEQALAVNVDTVFLVMALDGDFNARRLERYLAQVWDSGARAVILLNKMDVCDDIMVRAVEVERCALGVPVHAISATSGRGMEVLLPHLPAGETVALLGSSGVGKSSIVNWLLGADQQSVQAVREHDGRGRHTTTRRHLFFLASGAMIVDTPGLRELQLWDAEESLHQAFGDLRELSGSCHFRNCSHRVEPGCAVAAAISGGLLEAGRLENYQKLQREQGFLKRKKDAGMQQAAKQRIKTINRAARRRYRQRDEKGKL